MGQWEVYQILMKNPNRWLTSKDFEIRGLDRKTVVPDMRKLSIVENIEFEKSLEPPFETRIRYKK